MLRPSCYTILKRIKIQLQVWVRASSLTHWICLSGQLFRDITVMPSRCPPDKVRQNTRSFCTWCRYNLIHFLTWFTLLLFDSAWQIWLALWQKRSTSGIRTLPHHRTGCLARWPSLPTCQYNETCIIHILYNCNLVCLAICMSPFFTNHSRSYSLHYVSGKRHAVYLRSPTKAGSPRSRYSIYATEWSC